MFSKEDLQGVQLLRHTLDIIQTINTDNQLNALELLLQELNTVSCRCLLELPVELLWVDTNWEGSNGHIFTLQLNSVWRSLHLQNPRTRRQEVSRIIVGVETDQVTRQNTGQQLLSHRQDSVNLRRWEWSVKEEANLDVLLGVTNLLAEHLWEEHEMVVVHPDHVAVLHVFGHGLGEEAVDLAVGGPGGLVERDFSWVVVEEWPEDGVCELVSVIFQKYGGKHTYWQSRCNGDLQAHRQDKQV